MDANLARFGEVQGDYQQLGGYELEARAREVLHGLGFHDEQVEGSMSALSAGWRMRVSMQKRCPRTPMCCCSTSPRTTRTSSRSRK